MEGMLNALIQNTAIVLKIAVGVINITTSALNILSSVKILFKKNDKGNYI